MKKIINFIKHSILKPRESVVASNKLSLDEVRKVLGSKSDNMTDEEVQKHFMEKLTTEEQMKAFFGKKS